MSFNTRGSRLDTKTWLRGIASLCLPSRLLSHTHSDNVTADPLRTSESSFWFAYHAHIFSITSVCWAVLGGKEERRGKNDIVCLSGVHRDSFFLSLFLWQCDSGECRWNRAPHTHKTHTHTHGWLTDCCSVRPPSLGTQRCQTVIIITLLTHKHTHTQFQCWMASS